MTESVERFTPQSRQAWRQWLTLNHDKVKGVQLVFFKKNSGISTLSYEDAVEEALCFGWIDGRTNKLDDKRYLIKFSQRLPGSTWAKSNKERVARLIKEGQMTPAGLQVIERAKKDGSWDSLNELENLVLPGDLEEAIRADKIAWKNFQVLSPSVKKQVLWWLYGAKLEQTRSSRIQHILDSLQNGINPVQHLYITRKDKAE
jgi:uncharacterized protein YdeI (YjbR/CyaY-like superfamily)